MQIPHRLAETGRDSRDAIARQIQRLQSRHEREIGESGDIVVGQVDGVLIADET